MTQPSMRWISYLILAYLITALQIGLSGFLGWGGVSPNLVLPAVVFIAINASREEALIGAPGLGLLQDLFTQHPIGLHAFSYGLVALFVIGAQPSVYRDHPLTHLFVTLAAALVVGAVVLLNEWTYPILHPSASASAPSIGRALLRAVYTAAAAPVLLWPLVRIKAVFAFRGARRTLGGRLGGSAAGG